MAAIQNFLKIKVFTNALVFRRLGIFRKMHCNGFCIWANIASDVIVDVGSNNVAVMQNRPCCTVLDPSKTLAEWHLICQLMHLSFKVGD